MITAVMNHNVTEGINASETAIRTKGRACQLVIVVFPSIDHMQVRRRSLHKLARVIGGECISLSFRAGHNRQRTTTEICIPSTYK